VARDVDVKHLRYFLAVADEGTFTAAAERLRMTQPALSRAIRALEGELDTVLFLRTPQGAELTEAGHVLDRDARNLLEPTWRGSSGTPPRASPWRGRADTGRPLASWRDHEAAGVQEPVARNGSSSVTTGRRSPR
jgi:hypothetical protein